MHRDTQVLCDSLTYEQGPPVILQGEGDAEHTAIYRPPFEEFEVSLTTLTAGQSCTVPASQVCQTLEGLPIPYPC